MERKFVKELRDILSLKKLSIKREPGLPISQALVAFRDSLNISIDADAEQESAVNVEDAAADAAANSGDVALARSQGNASRIDVASRTANLREKHDITGD